MTIANVALTNTFDEWRNITNQLVYVVSDLENINVRIIFDTSNAAYSQANTARNLANNALANGMSNTFSTLTISSLALAGNIVLTGNIVASANLTGSTLFDNKGDIRVIPPNEKAAVYALVKSDVGKFVTISTSSNVFVPNAIFTQGDAVTIYNNSSASLNIVSNSAVTMYLAGTANTITRRLAQRGVATVLCVFANNFVISGSGLS